MQTITSKPLNIVWLKAAVMGSLWASVEIVFGSFLHNLRIPFSGTTLAFIAVWLLVAFACNWKEKGLIWRAGLIAALMKSISPSAVILGPMIGIFTEALLMDISIRLLGRNLIGFLIGGALAVISTLLHKALNLLILYGFDLVKVLDALFQFSADTLQTGHFSIQGALMVLGGLYATAGLVAALAGYFSGSRISRKTSTEDATPPSKIHFEAEKLFAQKSSELFSHSSGQQYSWPLLLLNLAAIVLAMVLITGPHLVWSSVFVGAYLLFVSYRYPGAFRRIRRFSFWIPFVLITMAAALLVGGLDNEQWFSREGLLIGIRMNVRAFVILTGFAAISTEMKNPTIKTILYKKGFASLYQALNLSFSALPSILEYLSDKNRRKGLRHLSFLPIMTAAGQMLKAFEKENEKKSPLVIITGNIGEGKTTFAQKTVERLHELHVPVSGFLSVGIQNKGQRTGFDLHFLESGTTANLCKTEGPKSWQRFGKYAFNPKGLEAGNSVLHPERLHDKKVLVVDEMGPLEINDSGWAPGIERVLKGTTMVHCWVVRKSLAVKMARKWDVGTVYLFDVAEDTPAYAAEKIRELAEAISSG